MRHPRAHSESRKEYDVNFTYTSRIQRQLYVYAEFTDTMYVVGRGYSGSQVEKGAPALLQNARGIGHRSTCMLLHAPDVKISSDFRDKPGTYHNPGVAITTCQAFEHRDMHG